MKNHATLPNLAELLEGVFMDTLEAKLGELKAEILAELKTQSATAADDADKVMVFEEARRYLRCSTGTLNTLLQSGEIPSSKFGRLRRIRKTDIDNYLQAKKQGA